MQFIAPKRIAYPPCSRGKIVVWGLMAHALFGGMSGRYCITSYRYVDWDSTCGTSKTLMSWSTTRSASNHQPSANRISMRLREVMEAVGLGDRWVFRAPMTRSFQGSLDGNGLRSLYTECEAAFNLCGAQDLSELDDVIQALGLH